LQIKRNGKAMNAYNLIARFESNWDKERRFDFEVMYFRKCWNVRSAIAQSVGGIVDNGYTDLTRDDIPKIIDALKSFNSENWYDDHSIWDWEDQEEPIKMYIENLEYLYELMDSYDLDIYFYDSY
jgi:hypothetical protein